LLQRKIAIGLLLLYLLFMFRMFVPHIEYQIRKQYIVDNLCENRFQPQLECDGNCHIKKQIARLDVAPVENSTQKQESPKKGNKKTFETEYSQQFKLNFILEPNIILQKEDESLFFSFFPDPPFHPPQY